jgi:hypothetical protein
MIGSSRPGTVTSLHFTAHLKVALALLTANFSGLENSRKWLSRLAGQFTMSTMPKNDTIPVEDEEFALYGVMHSNRPGSLFVPLLAPASMQLARDTYLRSILCPVPDDHSELSAAYV